MTTHDCRALLENRYGRLGTKYEARIQIVGAENGFAGYGICFIPKGQEARKETGGPLVPGPWASAFGLCTVIAIGDGTVVDVAKGKANGQCIEVEPGDRLVLDESTVVEVTLDRRRYPILTVVSE